MSEHNCPDIVKVGSNPTIADWDSQRFLHKSIYDKLLLSYHDSSCDAISGFAFPEVFYFENAGVPFDIANNYDVISSQDFSDAIGYLNLHYQAAHRNNKSSGNHNDFEKFVGNLSISAQLSFMAFTSVMPSKSCHSSFARCCHARQLVYIINRECSKSKIQREANRWEK